MTDVAAVVRELEVFLLIALIVILVVRRLAIPYTLGLVVAGLLISIAGLLPEERLTPDLVLFVFLPALLFEGSWSAEIQRLRANWVSIFLLAGPGLLLSLAFHCRTGMGTRVFVGRYSFAYRPGGGAGVVPPVEG